MAISSEAAEGEAAVSQGDPVDFLTPRSEKAVQVVRPALTGFNVGAILTSGHIEIHGLVYLEIFSILSLVACFGTYPTDLANTTLLSRILEYHMQIPQTYYFEQATLRLRNRESESCYQVDL